MAADASHSGAQTPVATPDASRVTVRYFQDDDANAALRLLQDAFPTWPQVDVSADPLDHLRWKLQLDQQGTRIHKVAETDGKIVGLVLALVRRAKLRGRAVRCFITVDACVHPAYRERGVMTAIRDFARGEDLRPYALAYVGQSRHAAMIRLRPEQTRHRFPIGNRVERFVRPVSFRETLAAFRLGSGQTPRKLANSSTRLARWLAGRLRTPQFAPGAACTVRDVSEFDERIDGLWQDASAQFDFVMTRDRAHLNWRYADRRAGDFTLKFAEDGGGSALGYIVLCNDRRRRRGYVADVLARPGRADVAQALLTEAVAWARAAHLGAVECWLPVYHPYREALRSCGFVMRRRKEVAEYRVMHDATHEELAFLQDPDARIHITLGDTDRV